MSDYKRYIIGNTAVPPDERDRFRALSKTDAYRNLRVAEPEVGAQGSYTIELTEREAADLAEDPPSNLRYIEEDGPGSRPGVDNVVPADIDLRDSRADRLFEWGFTGRGIDVGVMDTGLGAEVSKKFSIKAIRGENGLTPYHGTHGSKVASIAVPKASRLVFSRCIDEDGENNLMLSDEISAVYWMVDDIGVHIINMSISGSGFSQSYADALAHASSKSVMLVAAAGNDASTTPAYPANYPGVLTVGSLDASKGWARASHSNYGPWVDMWAKGVNVTTYGPAGYLTTGTGTSFAAPLVSFVKASLLTKGLKSIGQIKVQQAVQQGDGEEVSSPHDPQEPSGGEPTVPAGEKFPAMGVPSGVGGGKRLNGKGAAWKMRDFCE